MALKTKKEALDSIVERKKKDGSSYYDAYLGVNVITKKVVRIFGNDLENVRNRIKRYYASVDRLGPVGSLISPIQIIDAKTAYDELAAHGLNITLVECVKRVLGVLEASSAKCRRTVAELYEEFSSERASSVSEQEVRATKSRTGKWAEACGDTPICDVTGAEVVAYLGSVVKSGSAKTWNNHFTYIRTFLGWCAKKPRCYIQENPLDGIDLKPVASKEPDCIDVGDMKRLCEMVDEMRDEHPEYAAYIALSFFCGVRREEILRYAASELANDDKPAAVFRLDNGLARIIRVKGWKKGARPRAFIIPKTARAWMESVDFYEAAKLITEKTVEDIYAKGRARNIVIPKNCGRHSFITYHVCAYEDLQKTLIIAGTSEGMSAEHYRSLKTRDEGLAYFSILPSRATSS